MQCSLLDISIYTSHVGGMYFNLFLSCLVNFCDFKIWSGEYCFKFNSIVSKSSF